MKVSALVLQLLFASEVTAFLPAARPTTFVPTTTRTFSAVATELKSEVDENAVEPAEEVGAVEPASEDVVAEVEAEPEEAERHTVFVGNLPFDLSDESFREMCTPHGDVVSISLPKDRNTGSPRGFAFVDMGTKDEAEALIGALNQSEVLGRTIRASVSVPKDQQKKPAPKPDLGKLYVGNLPFDATQDEVKEFFAEYSDVIEVFMPLDQNTGSPRGFGFVTINSGDVERVIEETNGLEFDGRPLTVNKPLAPGEKVRRNNARNQMKLYVGNLSFDTMEETLEEVFSEFGDVFDCYMPTDRDTGRVKGFAFVTMDKEAALDAIEELDGVEIDGRYVRVNESQPKGRRFEG